MRSPAKPGTGFTLIELLIVVAIIAILAAIAVPNLLEAQTRSKVSRVKADQRTIATALEAYAVDNNNFYPPDGDDIFPFAFPVDARQVPLTTPIAYMTSIPDDPFHVAYENDPYAQVLWPRPTGPYKYAYLTYGAIFSYLSATDPPPNDGKPNNWGLVSIGPNKKFDTQSIANIIQYDPTNGTISGGDIVRFGGSPLPNSGVTPTPGP